MTVADENETSIGIVEAKKRKRNHMRKILVYKNVS